MAESRSLKAALLASGQLLTTVVRVLTGAVLSRGLSSHGYATYQQTLLAFNTIATVLIMGLPRALYFFLPGEETRAFALTLENVGFLGAIGFAFSLFVGFGGNRVVAREFSNDNRELAHTLLIGTPYAFSLLPTASVESCLVARNKVAQVAIYNVGTRLIAFIAIVVPCYLWRSASAVTAGLNISGAISVIWALYAMYYAVSPGQWRPQWSSFWQQFKYSIPLGLAGMSSTLYFQLSKTIVSRKCSSREFAIYTNGAYEVPLVSAISGSVTSVLLPSFRLYHQQGKIGDLITLWVNAMTKTSLLIFPLTMLCFALAPEIMTVIFSEQYRDSAEVFRYYVATFPTRIISYGAVLGALGMTGWILALEVGSMVTNVVLSYLLIERYGYMGGVYATVITFYLSIIAYLWPIQMALGVRLIDLLPLRRLSLVMLCSISCLPWLWLKPYLPESSLIRLMVLTPLMTSTILAALQVSGLIRMRELWKTVSNKLLRKFISRPK